MADNSHNEAFKQRLNPTSLETLSSDKIVQLLVRLNNSINIADCPWLNKETNPFLCVPQELIEDILFKLSSALEYTFVKKELLKILICKPMRHIILNGFSFKDEDIVNVVKTLECTKATITYLNIDTHCLEDEYNPWIKVPEALSALKECVKSMHSLTHLNVNGICDDELLECVALCCPNLRVLEAFSPAVTNEGLKRLCMNTGKGEDEPKRCQKLQFISIDEDAGEDYYLEGIQALLINLPNLQVLWCSRGTLAKAIKILHDKTNEMTQFQLREFSYNGTLNLPNLSSVIAMRCPFLTKLQIRHASNVQLMSLESLHSLKDIAIYTKDNLMNFGQHVAPFLKKVGQGLEKLHLEGFTYINFDIIDACCRNLTKLHCETEGALIGDISTKSLFRNLKVLSLISGIKTGLLPRDITRLLSSCYNLEHLTLCCCKNLKKCHFKEIFLRNPLESLTMVVIISNSLSIIKILEI